MNRKLWIITVLLIFLHLVVLFTGRWGWGLPEPIGRLFFLDQEYNVPAFYSSFLFLVSAFYCFRLGLEVRVGRKLISLTWFFLSILLVFFSADEWFGIHENLIEPLRSYFGIQQGFFFFSWTIVYIVLIAVVALVTIPWILSLERSFRKRLVLSAFVYISGALGFELLGSLIYSTNGHEYTPLYANIVTIEESLELIGLTLAALTLARFFGRRGRSFLEPIARPEQ